MTDTRHASPIPPYTTPQAGTRGPILTGQVLDGRGGPRRAYGMTYGAPTRVVPQKSLLLAGLLAAIFPPFGMIYATLFGTVVMTGLTLVVALVTLGHGLPVLWPLCVVWAVWAAHAKNQRRLAWASVGF